jgi:deazaflavin-dependent oxidoreductase (nitroreductase family)
MKLPEPLFAIINPTMALFLRSPIHWLWSGSLMLITFTGRKSGKKFTTPVRYIENDETIRCFTSSENQWWRNVRGGAEVELCVRGKASRYAARAVDNDPEEVKRWLVYYLELFPQDAAYHDIKINKDKSLVEEDLDRASHKAVVIEANPISTVAGDAD